MAFAVDIDGVSRIKVDAKRDALRFPAETFDLAAEERRGPLLVIATQSPDARPLAVRDRHNASLMWGKVNLKCQFVSPSVAVQIVCLGGQLFRLQNRGVFFHGACVACRHDHRTRFEVQCGFADFCDRNGDVRRTPGIRTRVGDGHLNILDLLRPASRTYEKGRDEPQHSKIGRAHCFLARLKNKNEDFQKRTQEMWSSRQGVNTSMTSESSIADAPCSTPPRTTKLSPVQTSTVLPWQVTLRCPCTTYTTCSCGWLCTVPTQPFTISCSARNNLS